LRIIIIRKSLASLETYIDINKERGLLRIPKAGHYANRSLASRFSYQLGLGAKNLARLDNSPLIFLPALRHQF